MKTINTEDQVADLLTKGLNPKKSKKLRDQLGMIARENLTKRVDVEGELGHHLSRFFFFSPEHPSLLSYFHL